MVWMEMTMDRLITQHFILVSDFQFLPSDLAIFSGQTEAYNTETPPSQPPPGWRINDCQSGHHSRRWCLLPQQECKGGCSCWGQILTWPGLSKECSNIYMIQKIQRKAMVSVLCGLETKKFTNKFLLKVSRMSLCLIKNALAGVN